MSRVKNIDGMGDRGIMIAGGTLNLHGDRTNSWTKLAGTAKAGSARIEVLNAKGWRKGDVIVLASTDFDSTQAEKRTIAAIAGNAITLDQPLQYMHFGKITFGVDERGEVGMLTRNILIHASADAERSYFGGHIMAMARVADACLRRRTDSDGSEHAPRPVSDPLARRWRRKRTIHHATLPFTTPTAGA